MTGPEHYRSADKLLQEAHREAMNPHALRLLQFAQVHATLALAAATAQAPVWERHGWDEAVSS